MQQAPALTAIWDTAALEDVFAQSDAEPVLLFLHAPHCRISRWAEAELRTLGAPAAVIDVARTPALSRAVEARTGVRHASPQVLVLRNGIAVWNASHYAITTEALANALRSSG